MHQIQETLLTDYTYDLPNESIAKYPTKERDSSKLLLYKQGEIIDEAFKNCSTYLPKDSLLIFNNTKVIQARIVMHKKTGAQIEIFCLEPNAPKNYEQIFGETSQCEWICIIGNAKKWKDEVLHSQLIINSLSIEFSAKKISQHNGETIIEFSWTGGNSFSEIIDTIGKIPIPPYLHRDSEDIDLERYQTIYAQHNGSVAAPTAGLHFTDKVLEQITSKNIEIAHVTLHVGAGTFKPVKTENVLEHTMHRELFRIDKKILNQIASKKSITAVGTTTVRTLESIYWLGVKCIENSNTICNELNQWEAYTLPQHYTIEESCNVLLLQLEKYNKDEIFAYTQIMIVPGYRFKIVKALFTNFHQPQSTLLLLIAAFIGKDWKQLYNHALENKYRFLSYGDSSLLIP
jgi:S-adenosylmethionine:tRNA ribosyltransferase-isomerase